MSTDTRDPRELFGFFDGKKQRRIDPMKAMRLLATDPELTDDVIKLCSVEDNMAAGMAQQKLLNATRRAFGVTEYSDEDDSGITEKETIELFYAFHSWCDALKKNGNPSQTSSDATESVQADST